MSSIVKGWDGHFYIVFENEEQAAKYHVLLNKILRRKQVCCGGYYNGYILF